MDGDSSADARRELASWSQPVIYDLLHGLYAQRLGAEHPSLRVLSLSNGRLWRLVLLGDVDKLDAARREVLNIGRLAHIDPAIFDDINQNVLEELLDVVVARYLRTPSQACAFGHILLDAAAILARHVIAAA